MKLKLLALFAVLFSGNKVKATQDTCSDSIRLLDAKLNKVLHILESHFRTNYDKFDNNAYSSVGVGKANSGNSYSGSNPGYNNNLNRNSVIGGYDHGLGGNAGSSFISGHNTQTNSAGSNQKASHANAVGGAAYIDVEAETELNGYKDELAYLGNNVQADERGKVEGYHKGEGYGHDVSDGYTYEADYTGTRINDSIMATRVHQLREEQDIEENFFNDEKKENHQGSYHGNEYDIANKFKKVDGGFNDKTDKKSIQQSAYSDGNYEGSNYNDGKYYALENNGHNEEDKNLDVREVEYYTPNEYDNNLYDKFNGKKIDEKQPEFDDKFGGGGHGNGHGVRREDYEKSKDYDDRFYENEFKGNDAYGKNSKQDQNVGYKSEAEAQTQYNNGAYQDVSAQGHNKGAAYKGDYSTRSDQKDAGYHFKNVESVEELATPDRFATLVINDNTVTFKGSERKHGNYDDYKTGRYDEKEINKKLDNDKHANRYRGNDYNVENDRELEANVNYYGHKDARAEEENFQKDYRGGDREYRPTRKRERGRY